MSRYEFGVFAAKHRIGTRLTPASLLQEQEALVLEKPQTGSYCIFIIKDAALYMDFIESGIYANGVSMRGKSRLIGFRRTMPTHERELSDDASANTY